MTTAGWKSMISDYDALLTSSHGLPDVPNDGYERFGSPRSKYIAGNIPRLEIEAPEPHLPGDVFIAHAKWAYRGCMATLPSTGNALKWIPAWTAYILVMLCDVKPHRAALKIVNERIGAKCDKTYRFYADSPGPAAPGTQLPAPGDALYSREASEIGNRIADYNRQIAL